jgi:dynactin complex subunit
MGRESKSLCFKSRKRTRSDAQKEQLQAARSSTSPLPTQSDAENKENREANDIQAAKERAAGYQKALYNERKKLKRSHAAYADQSTYLAETLAENGHLHAEVDNLTAEITDLHAESSGLRASIASTL